MSIAVLARAGFARQPSRAARQAGVTLIELIVTLAIAAILMAMAAPSFTGLINANKLTSSSNELVATLQLARMEAIRRNATVQVCGSDDLASCDGGDRAWLVVAPDGNNDGVATDPEVVRVGPVDAAVQSSSSVGDVVFRADGFARRKSAPDGALLTSSFRFCLDVERPAENVRVVQVESGSRISTRSESGQCG